MLSTTTPSCSDVHGVAQETSARSGPVSAVSGPAGRPQLVQTQLLSLTQHVWARVTPDRNTVTELQQDERGREAGVGGEPLR